MKEGDRSKSSSNRGSGGGSSCRPWAGSNSGLGESGARGRGCRGGRGAATGGRVARVSAQDEAPQP